MKVQDREKLDRTEPALIVKCGNTAKKHIVIDRSALTLGRAHGCDVELDAPDVSGIHCVITRNAFGVAIRDCASRAGTKVNGDKVREAPLHNTDVVQVGPFSFEVYLPWLVMPRDMNLSPNVLCKQQLRRLERSRARLGALALSLRRRLHAARAGASQAPDLVETLPTLPRELKRQALLKGQAEQMLTERHAEIERQEETLQARGRVWDQKMAHLEESEQSLAARQGELDRRAEALEQETRDGEQKKQQLAEAHRRFSAERAASALDFTTRESHLRKSEHELAQREATMQGREMTALQKLPSGPSAEDLQLHERELAGYEQQLRQEQQQLHEREKCLQEERVRLDSREKASAQQASAEMAAAWQEKIQQLGGVLDGLERRLKDAERQRQEELQALLLAREQLASFRR